MKEIWVMAQDKKFAATCAAVSVEFVYTYPRSRGEGPEGYWRVWGAGYELGTYKTKEKALGVFNLLVSIIKAYCRGEDPGYFDFPPDDEGGSI